jgi:hypothetical protein
VDESATLVSAARAMREDDVHRFRLPTPYLAVARSGQIVEPATVDVTRRRQIGRAA